MFLGQRHQTKQLYWIMHINYYDLKPCDFIGGEGEKHNNRFLISQSQHVIRNNKMYIVSMLLNRIPRALNKNGEYMNDIGGMGYSDSEFSMSAGMTFHENDQILITDVNEGKVLIFQKDNFNFIAAIKNKFEKPNCIISIADKIYVGDMGSNTVRVFDKNFNDQFVISRAGETDLEGTDYLSYDSVNERLLVTDRDAGSIHIFSLDGVYQFSITENIKHPGGTTIDHHGNILVCTVAGGVKVYDKNGNYISNFSSKNLFTSPMDIYAKGDKINEDNEIVVLDGSIYGGWSRLQIFKY